MDSKTSYKSKRGEPREAIAPGSPAPSACGTVRGLAKASGAHTPVNLPWKKLGPPKSIVFPCRGSMLRSNLGGEGAKPALSMPGHVKPRLLHVMEAAVPLSNQDNK